jgi:hypothetical protein
LGGDPLEIQARVTMRPRRPSAATLERLLAEAKAAAPTYPEIGATRRLIRARGLWATLPCRVVYVDEAAEGFAFASATLPGHPEKGEVRFAVERGGAGEIVFRIVSFSRTVAPLARLGSPFTRRPQRQVTERYLEAIAGAAGQS